MEQRQIHISTHGEDTPVLSQLADPVCILLGRANVVLIDCISECGLTQQSPQNQNQAFLGV